MFHIPYLSSLDALKDSLFAGYGFLLPLTVSTGEAALVVGLVNAAIVAIFRLLEMRRRDRRAQELQDLRARVAELAATRDEEVR